MKLSFQSYLYRIRGKLQVQNRKLYSDSVSFYVAVLLNTTKPLQNAPKSSKNTQFSFVVSRILAIFAQANVVVAQLVGPIPLLLTKIYKNMRANYCRGCKYFDSQDKYCTLHEDLIRHIEDCDDYYNEDDWIDYTYGEDGPDDGHFSGD